MFRVWMAALWLAVPAAAQQQVYAAHRDPRLAAYIEEALDKNPSVRESFARYRAVLQKIPRATSLPDPMLEVMPFLRTMQGETVGVSFSQRLPWFGKLDERGRVALKEAEVMARMHEAVKADVARQVKLAYYDLAFVDDATAITDEEIDLLGRFERLAQARYSQGVGLQQAVVKLQAEITRSQNRLQQLRAQRVDAEAALNTVMDRLPSTAVAPVAVPARPVLRLDAADLQARAEQLSPEMQAGFQQIERDEKQIRAAKREFWPDFTLGVSYMNMSAGRASFGPEMPGAGRDVWNLLVGVEIPIQRRRRDAAVLEATESAIASKHAYRRQRNMIDSSIRSLSFRLQTFEDQIRLFEGTLQPQAEQALRTSEDAYSTGAVSVLELLDSQRMLLDIRLGLAQLNTDYLKTLAQLERVVGGPIPEVNS